MDAPVPHDSTIDRAAIETAARDMGIVPGDPAYGFVQYMLRSADAHAAEHQVHEARLAQLLDQAERQAGGQLARIAAGELPRAMDRMVLQRFRWWAAAAGIGLAVAVATGFGGGWWYRGEVPILAGVSAGPNKCEDHPDGGRLCWIPVWEKLPPGQH